MLAPSTQRIYKRAWVVFNQFTSTLSIPDSNFAENSTIALFVAHMLGRGFNAGTMATYLSAVGYYFKMSGLVDPTKSFLVQKLLVGVRRLRPSVDLRLPITQDLLVQLQKTVDVLCSIFFWKKLYSAMFQFAFYAFARIGEIALAHKASVNQILQLTDVSFLCRNGSVNMIKVGFKDFKHNASRKVHFAYISHPHAVQSLVDYLAVRGNKDGPLFVGVNGLAVPRAKFDKQLKSCISFMGMDTSFYKGHSFRIGGATLAALQGKTDAQIRLMGRWKSDSFLIYIRAPCLQ